MEENGSKTEERESPREGGLVWPLILIGLGVVFLLNNLGVLEWGVWWTLLRMWPILLVAAGIDLLIGRRSRLGALVAVVLIAALFAGAFWLVWNDVRIDRAEDGEEISYALDGASRAEVVLGPAAGSLRLAALSEPSDLAQGTIRLGSGEDLRRTYDVAGGVASLALESGGVVLGPGAPGVDERSWDLRLNRDVPLDLQIDLGVGEAEIDLAGMALEDLEVDMGVGQVVVTLPAEAGDLRATVDGAIGQIVILLPEGLGVRLQMDTALVGRQIPPGYEQRGDVFLSPGYEDADQRIDLTVNLAIGNVTVRALR